MKKVAATAEVTYILPGTIDVRSWPRRSRNDLYAKSGASACHCKSRLDRRLNGRVDPSDVLQETLLEVTKRRDDYFQSQSLSPFLWLRFLTTQQVINVHRRQLVAECRDARREVSLDYEVRA